jgi:hypothetical protein
MIALELWLYRKILNENSTEGNFYIQQPDKSWKWFAHVIEDKVRAKPKEWKSELKVYGKTAIPYGRYKVLSTWSGRFKRLLTGIFGVPDFEGIRIHNGTTELSSAGCPIISYKDVPGEDSNRLVNDKGAMNDLNSLVLERQKRGDCWITISDHSPT